MTLTANPTNYFAETEQVAFHPGHLVPGIDVTSDPLLQGRLFSYLDTQISRLGGPNFAQLPVNRPHAPVNDMLRDGMHQSAVHTGVAPSHPNTLDGGCPFHAGADEGAFVDLPVTVTESAIERAQPRSFDDHFSQARLFYRSLTEVEQEHVRDAYAFELAKCYEQAIKERQLRALARIDADLCAFVAEALGLAVPEPAEPLEDVEPSRALRMIGETWPIDGRVVAILAGDEVDAAELLRRPARRRHRGCAASRARAARRTARRDPRAAHAVHRGEHRVRRARRPRAVGGCARGPSGR